MEGPQEITVHGHQTAVVLSQKDYIALTRKTVSFVDFMQTSPLMGVELDLERNPSPNRDVVL
ncbi:MAG: type II toxin-antitoxin system prevent-host-death family antitoxin [Magnetococcales bacterium]|nr:type II toxin-antitoxin system prevent-host-death family antitoxin [Magnetococcales bacterium]